MSAARIAHAILWPIVVTAILGSAAVAGSREEIIVGPQEPHAPSVGKVLADSHGCWTGDAPADMTGKIPGHAVMTLPDGRTVYSTDVGRAMRHIFETPEAGLTVHAFCR